MVGGLLLWIDVVKSEANIADGPSRGNYERMQEATRMEVPSLQLIQAWDAVMG